jgi:hypothetical protein
MSLFNSRTLASPRVIALAWVIALLVIVTGLAGAGTRAVAARTRAKAALGQASRAIDQAARIAALRAALPPCLGTAADGSPLAPRIGRALSAAGAEPSALVNLAPLGVSTAAAPAGGRSPGGAALRTERTALTLAPITLPQLGTFLKAWQDSEPCWSLTAIDLMPETAGRRVTPGPGEDWPLRVTLSLQSVSAQKGRGQP